MLEVAEGLGGAVTERHGLLDFEVEPDLAVFDASLVLDRDECQEALQLARPAEPLVFGQRRRPEPFQARLDLLESGRNRSIVSGLRCRYELVEGRAGARPLARRTLVGKGRGEDREVPARE